MKMKKFFYLLAVCAMPVLTFNSCGDGDEPLPEPEKPVENNGLYILNGGNWKENNASLSYYDLKTEAMTPNIYKTANGGSGLGDSAEQILLYGSKTYITVPTSNRLVVLDANGKLLKFFEPTVNGNEPVNPRCMVANNGKVYVSYFYAHTVAALDTASLEITDEVNTGRYPEQLTVANDRIYVANSGGMDSDKGNTVSVINPATMTVEKEIEVMINPVCIASDSEGDVYVISWADHGVTTNQTLQRIDAATNEVTTIGNASQMTIVNDKIYTIWSQYYNSPGTAFQIFDALTESRISENFITDGTTVVSPNAIAVDSNTEKIYLTHYDYSTTSTLYVFSADGKLEKEVDTGGYNAKSMAFSIK
jgi:YVTN family beta-propeller protein